jgi:hypothetical protein
MKNKFKQNDFPSVSSFLTMESQSANMKFQLTEEQMPLFIADLKLFNAILSELPLTPDECDLVERKFQEHVLEKYGKK